MISLSFRAGNIIIPITPPPPHSLGFQPFQEEKDNEIMALQKEISDVQTENNELQENIQDELFDTVRLRKTQAHNKLIDNSY